MDKHPQITALGPRVHMFVQPAVRERFIALFKDVLECNIVEQEVGLQYPILFVPFGDGSGFSVEFTEHAPAENFGHAADDEHAFRGAWIEFRASDVPRYHQRLRDAGIPEFRHAGSPHVYFSAPGGQVFRVIDVAYKGP